MNKRNQITPDIVEEIKQRNDIASVVEGYVHLTKKSSSNLFGLCPFHSEKTPSFSVSPHKQIYYCFGCHKGGDVVHFIMDIEKISYFDALRYLAEKSGIQLPESDDAEYRKRAELKKQLIDINTEAARYFYRNLTGENGKTAMNYILKRGIDIPTMKKFGIGYAIDNWSGLLNHLTDKGFSNERIFQSGLVKHKDNGRSGQGYDLFRNRLIFPIIDQMGRIVAFGGRVFDDSMPKYLNSPETPVYTKGRHLYGFNIAKTSKAGKMLVVEGYMDLLAVYQAGIDYVVASLGTALTEQQAMLLRNYSEEVIICYDADAAGQNATMRGLEILKKKGCKVSVLRLSEAKDPDEYIRKFGPERFKVLIDRALPLMDYKLITAYESSLKGGKLDKLEYQDRACDILASEENIVVRELYSVGISEKLGVSPDNILAEADRRNKNSPPNTSPTGLVASRQDHNTATEPDEEDDENEISATATNEEIKLLCVMAYSPAVFKALENDLCTDDFSHGIMRDLSVNAITLAKAGKLSDTSLIALGEDHIVNDRKLAELLASDCMESGEVTDENGAIEEALKLNRKIRIKRLRAEKTEIVKKISSGMNNEDEKKIAKQRLSDLEKELNKYKD